MSNKNKLERFAELAKMPNVFENFSFEQPTLIRNGKAIDSMPSQWNKVCFERSQPIFLELACGKGEYTLGLAQRCPDHNFIGVDIKGARLWKGAKEAYTIGLNNVAFLRTRIELIQYFFGKGEINGIWITFPDPFLKDSKSNRRLTSHAFLDRYYPLLADEAKIILKTDDPSLYAFTLEVLSERKDYHLIDHQPDIYSLHDIPEEYRIQTFYESQHLAAGKTIKIVKFMKTDSTT